mgnify:CR=1 FL=1
MSNLEGEKAPAFNLEGSDGKKHALSDYQGKTVILYFYPKDDTPGCTTQSCNLRDNYTDLQREGYEVLGVSRTVKNGQTVEFEFMQLRVNADGKLVFIALPSGQKETTFVASSVGEHSVTFENPRHDFPQKVTYRLESSDRLVARIEGTRGGTLRGFDIPMRRGACDASMAK